MKAAAPTVITTVTAFDDLLARLTDVPLIAVDTEADSLYSYFEKVCLIQFSIPEADFILDTLAVKQLDALGVCFADPRIEKIFHACEYDILSLKRDYGFTFENIFDTMVAARVLGWKQIGLGAILEQYFGVKLDKRFQRADWGKRPLTREQLEYARDDTHYLIPLRDLQKAELEKLVRLDEVQEEFARLERVVWGERPFDPNRYWALDGARQLNPLQLGILRELYQFREQQARQEDRPPFKLLGNATLVQLAHIQPATLSELKSVKGIGEWVVRKHGHAIIKAIERGLAHPQVQPPRLANARRAAERQLDVPTRERLARLKEWRKARAAARGVDADVIVSNEVLLALARKNPKTIEALAQGNNLGKWKAREYGEELLRVLDGGK